MAIVFRNRLKGMVVIEFLGGFFALFLLFAAWVEMSMIGFVSSALDYAISETARDARTTSSDDYNQVFRSSLKNNNSLWAEFLHTDRLILKATYYNSLSDLAHGRSTTASNPKGASIGVYRVSYDYQPVFTTFFTQSHLDLSREVIGVQEYERDKFSD